VSKNSSGYGFKKKNEVETNRYELRGFQKQREVSREDSYTNRSKKNNSGSHEKSIKNENSSHKKSIYEEEETLEEQGYGVLIRDMKRCIKG
jgi:hypothetical protein